MRKFCISGTDPRTGETRIFATYAPEDEIADYIARGEAEGWTNLVQHKQANPSLWDEEQLSEEAPEPKTPRGRGKKK